MNGTSVCGDHGCGECYMQPGQAVAAPRAYATLPAPAPGVPTAYATSDGAVAVVIVDNECGGHTFYLTPDAAYSLAEKLRLAASDVNDTDDFPQF